MFFNICYPGALHYGISTERATNKEDRSNHFYFKIRIPQSYITATTEVEEFKNCVTVCDCLLRIVYVTQLCSCDKLKVFPQFLQLLLVCWKIVSYA